jgi:hypothetical protein
MAIGGLLAADVKVDLSKRRSASRRRHSADGRNLDVQQDGFDKVIGVDGRPWVASKDNPTKLLIEVRRLYGTTNVS